MSTAMTTILNPLALDPLVFDDPTPIEVKIKIGGKRYILREASAGSAVAYANARMRAAKMDDGKLTGFDGMFEADLILLSMNLHPCKDHKDEHIYEPLREAGSGEPHCTPVQRIKAWKDSVYKPLLARLKDISPSLEETDTPATLQKQIDNLQKRLDDMLKKEAANNPPTAKVDNNDSSDEDDAEDTDTPLVDRDRDNRDEDLGAKN